jgi:hypothetical protein
MRPCDCRRWVSAAQALIEWTLKSRHQPNELRAIKVHMHAQSSNGQAVVGRRLQDTANEEVRCREVGEDGAPHWLRKPVAGSVAFAIKKGLGGLQPFGQSAALAWHGSCASASVRSVRVPGWLNLHRISGVHFSQGIRVGHN